MMSAESYSTSEVLAQLDAAIAAAGGLRAFARAHQLAPSELSNVRTGRVRQVPPSVAKALGLIREVRYVREDA